MKSKEKEERNKIKEQQCRTSKTDVKLLRVIFLEYLADDSDDTVDQSLDEQSCRHPFRCLSTQTEEYCETSTAQYVSVRITATSWRRWKHDQCRTFAD